MSIFQKFLSISLGGTLISLAVYFFTLDAEPDALALAPEDNRAAVQERHPVPESSPLPQAAPEPEPVRNDSSDSIFSIDAGGNPIIDHGTVHRLNRLIEQLPAQHASTDIGHIEAVATEGLPAPAAAKVSHILQAYITYTREEAALSSPQHNQDAGNAAETLKRLIALRRQHFSSQIAEALFGRQEMEARFGIGVAEIENDTSLSPEEKANRVAKLQQTVQTELYKREQAGSANVNPAPAQGTSPDVMRRSPF
ncbi:MAG: hypothetical protein A3I66_00150 [Burkholderiales bacterium RIFCSPLOWO2_02_FULL_57_36]|nr:MAG: hypothetical protein A3I66_00150 [Burkholderiales bacterium RIFCSPLOWO2_02_FULL_57_36]